MFLKFVSVMNGKGEKRIYDRSVMKSVKPTFAVLRLLQMFLGALKNACPCKGLQGSETQGKFGKYILKARNICNDVGKPKLWACQEMIIHFQSMFSC